MFILKPYNPLNDDWHCCSKKRRNKKMIDWLHSPTWEDMKKAAPPAKYKKKKIRKDKRGNALITYSKFERNTNFWNLTKFFGTEDLGNSYLYFFYGRDKESARTGYQIDKNGEWSCCTVLPNIEYRVKKVVVRVPQKWAYRNDYHRYDILVFFVKPLFGLIEDGFNFSKKNFIRPFRALFYALKYFGKGWVNGWYGRSY